MNPTKRAVSPVRTLRCRWLGACWSDVRCLLPAVCAFLAASPVHAGVPGTGFVIDAISDEFEAPWTFNYQTNLSSNGLWYGEYRGAPEVLQLLAPPGGAVTDTTTALRMRSIDNGDDAYPGAEDLVTNFYSSTLLGRAVAFAEQPSFVTWAYFPPVATWPLTAGGQNCFGFRVAARDHTLVSPSNATGEYYPSLWAFRDSDGKGYLAARVGDGFVFDVIVAPVDPAAGWYTLGLSWDAQGRTEYYAAPGRVRLLPSHLLYTDTASVRVLETVQYHFYSLRFPPSGSLSPDFLADRCRVFTRTGPRIPFLQSLATNSTTFSMGVAQATAGFLYRVERRSSLTTGSWQEVERFVGDGQLHTFSEHPGSPQMFYHVAHGPETLPPTGSLARDPQDAPNALMHLPARSLRIRTAPTWQ